MFLPAQVAINVGRGAKIIVPITLGTHSFAVWKPVAFVGICLIAIGVGAGYVDVATSFRFPFLSDHFDIFLLALLIGIVSAFAGLVGWARHWKRGTRARAAGIVFRSPLLAVLLGYPAAGDNIHGPAGLLLLMMIPASILALVLLLMSGY